MLTIDFSHSKIEDIVPNQSDHNLKDPDIIRKEISIGNLDRIKSVSDWCDLDQFISKNPGCILELPQNAQSYESFVFLLEKIDLKMTEDNIKQKIICFVVANFDLEKLKCLAMKFNDFDELVKKDKDQAILKSALERLDTEKRLKIAEFLLTKGSEINNDLTLALIKTKDRKLIKAVCRNSGLNLALKKEETRKILIEAALHDKFPSIDFIRYLLNNSAFNGLSSNFQGKMLHFISDLERVHGNNPKREEIFELMLRYCPDKKLAVNITNDADRTILEVELAYSNPSYKIIRMLILSGTEISKVKNVLFKDDQARDLAFSIMRRSLDELKRSLICKCIESSMLLVISCSLIILTLNMIISMLPIILIAAGISYLYSKNNLQKEGEKVTLIGYLSMIVITPLSLVSSLVINQYDNIKLCIKEYNRIKKEQYEIENLSAHFQPSAPEFCQEDYINTGSQSSGHVSSSSDSEPQPPPAYSEKLPNGHLSCSSINDYIQLQNCAFISG